MEVDILLSPKPLRVDDLPYQYSSAGAQVNFIGTVRDSTHGKKVDKLHFEAYNEMAIKEMEKIAQAIQVNWPSVISLRIHHRLGTLHVSEVPVVISISSPHREVAFKACQFAIDTLKKSVPIWKKEIFSSGEVWVSAHP